MIEKENRIAVFDRRRVRDFRAVLADGSSDIFNICVRGAWFESIILIARKHWWIVIRAIPSGNQLFLETYEFSNGAALYMKKSTCPICARISFVQFW